MTEAPKSKIPAIDTMKHIRVIYPDAQVSDMHTNTGGYGRNKGVVYDTLVVDGSILRMSESYRELTGD